MAYDQTIITVQTALQVFRVGRNGVVSIRWTVDRRWGVNYPHYRIEYEDGHRVEVYPSAVVAVETKPYVAKEEE